MTSIAEQIQKYQQSTERLARSTIRLASNDDDETNRFLDAINEVRLPLDEVSDQLKNLNDLLLKNFNILTATEVDFILSLASETIEKTRAIVSRFKDDMRFHFIENCLSELASEVNHFEEIVQDIEHRYIPDDESEEIKQLLSRISQMK